MKPDDILKFWFEEIDSSFWFKKDLQFDQQIKLLFLDIYKKIRAGETSEWRLTPEGRLAEIIVLDQFSRNMFRDNVEAFAGDELALQLAQEAVKIGADQKLPLQQRSFLYMPYMHSEDAGVHGQAVELFSQKGLEGNLRFELAHKAIIDRFGRFPHRNRILGRASTEEEIEFLKQPGSSF